MAATRTIDVKTEIPGPRSREILARKERVVAEPLSVYLAVGHSHPRVVAAAQEQLQRFSHTDFTVVPYETYVALAERLLALAPFTTTAKAAFFNAGTEAIENSIKFARAYTKRPAVVVFEGAFHGRTLLAMTMTSKTHPYKAGLGTFAPEVYRVPSPH